MLNRALFIVLVLTVSVSCKSLVSHTDPPPQEARRALEARALKETAPLGSPLPEASSRAVEVKQDRVAILPLVNKTSSLVSQDEVGLLTEVVRNAAQRLPHDDFLVMRNESITVLLPEGTSLEDCQGECEVETGRLLGAHWLVTGSVVRFGKSLRVTLALFDTRKAQQVASRITKGLGLEELEGALHRDALTLLSSLEPELIKDARAPVASDLPARMKLPELSSSLSAELQALDDPDERLDQERFRRSLKRFQSPLVGGAGAKSFDSLDNLQALAAYDEALKAEQDEQVSPEERIKRWQSVAERSAELRPEALRRAEEWRGWLTRRDEARERQLNRLDERRDQIVAQVNELARAHRELQVAIESHGKKRDEAWGKLKQLLGFSESVVSATEKESWVSSFIQSFGADERLNPYISERALAPYLSADTVRPLYQDTLKRDGRELEQRAQRETLLSTRASELRGHLKDTEEKVSSFLSSMGMTGEATSLRVGQKVRVRADVEEPKYGWGAVSHSSVGVIKSISGRSVTVNFPEQSGWDTIKSELTPIAGTILGSDRRGQALAEWLARSQRDPSAHLSISLPERPRLTELIRSSPSSAQEPKYKSPEGATQAHYQRREDFRSEGKYVEYLKEVLRPQQRVRARTSHGQVRVGDEGVYYGATPGEPPCFVIWDRKIGASVQWFKGAPKRKAAHAYWVNWENLELIGAPRATTAKRSSKRRSSRAQPRSRFSSEREWGAYLLKTLTPGDRVRARRTIKGNREDVPRGATGTFYEAGHNPPAFVVWDRYAPDGCFTTNVNGSPAKDNHHGWCSPWDDIEPYE